MKFRLTFSGVQRRASPFVLLSIAALLLPISANAQFVHPGGLHNQADLDRMKAHVLAGDHPWIDGWNRFLADTGNVLAFNPRATPNMGNSRQNASGDAHIAYNAFLRWYISGDTAYADKAVQICNAWSATVNQVPSGTDIPGLSGIPVFEFAMVGELLRIYPGWASADFDRFKNMMLTYWYPVCHDFLTNHNGTCVTHWWANWDACNLGALIAIGVLCDDRAIFDEGVNYFETGVGAGSMPNAVYYIHPGGLGQWQESGRDQEHAQLGVGLLGAACEIAWKQGVDLYGFDDNRLLKGAEYVARANLSRPVPYVLYNNCDNVQQSYISINGMGRLDDRPVWELIYNHYVVRKGLGAPNVRKIAELMRPEHGSVDHFGYGTLTFTLDAAASPYPASAIPPPPTGFTATSGVGRVMLKWEPSAGDTAQGYQIQRSTTSGGPYAAIASWADNTYPQRDDTSVTNGTTYYYVIAAINQSGVSARPPEISATPAAAGGLPDGWARQDVGSVNSVGSASYASVAGSTFIIGGNGTTIGGTGDSFSYAYRAVSGDSTIVGRLLINGNTKVGLMMRESLAANAKAASLTLGDVGGRETFLGSRSATAGPMSFTQGNDYTWTPVWYKLQRSGDTFTAFQSLDGVQWVEIASTSVPMSGVYFVGLAAVGGTATFDNVSVTGVFLAGPPTSLSAVNSPGQVTLNWTASTGATSYNVKRAAVTGGPYTTIAADVTATTYVDADLTNGTEFYYVVSAIQGAYETANSNEVLGLPGDVAFTWTTTPVSAFWGVGSNWTGGVAPADGASLTFAGSSIVSLNNDLTDLAVNRITFNSGAGAFTLAGNAIGLSGSVLNSSGTAQTISLPIILSGTRTISANTGQITLSGVISDGGAGYGLIKAGLQPVALTGQNTFGGNVVHNAGTLSLAGVGTGTPGSPVAGPLGRGTLQLGGGQLTSSAAATVFNNVVLQAGTTTSIASNTANLTLAGNISGDGNINESGANVGGTHFNGDNGGFTGTFTSNGGGNHRVRFNSATAGSENAVWVLNNNATDGYGLTFGSAKISFGALSGGGQFRSDSANGTIGIISVGALNIDTTFSGVMVANGTRFIGLEKVGTGRFTLTGNNSFDGPTTVVGGMLVVTNGYRSPVTVSGGIFGGTGSSNAAISVAAGSTLAPGNPAANQGVGTLTTTGAVTLNAGATYAVQLNSDTRAADKLVTGSINLDGTLLEVADLGGSMLSAGTSFILVDNTGANPVTGTFVGLEEGATLGAGGNLYRITYAGGTGNDIVLTVIVPTAITLDGLTQTYDGTPRVVTANTTPAGIPVSITYDGNANAPINAGSYAVVATTNDPGYVGRSTGILVVAPAPATLTLGNLTQIYDGSPRFVTAATIPADLDVSITYAGNATAPTDAGSYAVVATVNHPNYVGRATATLVVTKAPATVALANLNQTYDGTPKTASVSTTPVGLPTIVTYDGSITAPIAAGSYAVVVTINHSSYAGTVSGTLTIAQAMATVTLGRLTQFYDGTPRLVKATTIPADLDAIVTYDGSTIAPTYPGRYAVEATIDEPNYGGSATGTLAVITTALVRHGLALNGDLDGSAQVLQSESFAVNSNSAVSGDLLVCGTPTVQINGRPLYAGTLTGPGSAAPTNYTVTLNSGAVIRHVVRHIDPLAMSAVAAPPAPLGNRDVTINNPTQTIGNFATLRNLTLNSGGGTVTVPPGSYGTFTVNGSGTLVLGIAGSSEPAVYNLQFLQINSGASVRLAGPVVLTLASGSTVNGKLAATTDATWFTLKIASGGLTVNSTAQVKGDVIAPSGTVTLNGDLIGRVTADRLVINSSGALSEPAP
jgi:autotransporter-associated beta strand protein